MESTDVVVIGAGIIGSSTAYYLVKAGIKVTVLDRRERISSGTASQANAGGVRHQGRSAAELPLAIYSIRLWANLENELEADLQYRRHGMAQVIDDESQLPKLKARAARERSQGLDIRVLTRSELHDLIPGLNPNMCAGTYCPIDGHVDPTRATNALAVAAQRSGARIEWDCPATSLVADKGRLVAVETPGGRISCRHVILAAGAWSTSLAASVGIDLPMRPGLLQAMVTAPHPHVLDQVLSWVGRGISFKQVPSGGFVIGGGWQGRGNPAQYQSDLEPASMAKSAATAVRLFPKAGDVPILRAWVGIEGFTIDDEPIIGTAPDVSGIIIATGFSAHGFALGPGVGSLLSQYVLEGRMSELLLPFSIARFDHTSEVA